MKRMTRGKLRPRNLCGAAVLAVSGLGVAAPSVAAVRLGTLGAASATETAHTAIHLPTGCVARVTLDRRAFVSAAITDPDCLPEGVSARSVPGTRLDFRLVDLSLPD